MSELTPNQARLLRFVEEQVPKGQWTHLGEDARPDVLILKERWLVEINGDETKYRLPGWHEFKCTAEFGPEEEVRTAESPEGAAELYAEDHVDTEVDDLPPSVYVDVVDDTGKETEVLIHINATYSFKAYTHE